MMSKLIFLFPIFLILPYFYRKVWKSYIDATPSGYGVIIIFFILLFSILYQDYFFITSYNLIITLFVILILAVIYWIDDVKSLSIYFRILIQFISGFLISFFILESQDNYLNLIFICSFFGFFNIVLTNVLNFYDGADLNITLILLGITFSILYIFYNDQSIRFFCIAILFYLVSFSFYNTKSNFIYIGDSGCFTFSSLLTLFIVFNIDLGFDHLVFISIPLFLPVLDVFYVILLRIYLRENLTTRNYHHIYQKLLYRYKGLYYLLPQILNILVIYLFYLIAKHFLFDEFISMIVIGLTCTFINYFFIRKFLI